ncbi:reverse transcriptase domain-containing protein [Tanacetum coccineum]
MPVLSRAALGTDDVCFDQDAFEGILLRTTVMAQQSEIAELQAADRRRQSKILASYTAGPTEDPQSQELPMRPVAFFKTGYDCSYCTKNGTKGRPTKNARCQARSPPHSPTSFTTTPPPVTDPTTTTSVTSAQLQAMIDGGVTAVLAARATTRNGDDSHTSGTGARRNERTVRECTYQDFMKMSTHILQGNRRSGQLDPSGLRGMETGLRHKTVTNDVAYAMTWSDLKKKMTTKYCPRNEIKKIEAELWNLKVQGTDVVAYNQCFQELALLSDRMFPEETDKIERYVGGMPDLIYSSVVASKPKTMQEAIEMATELMDRRINTLAERQTENKRKFEDAPRNKPNPTNQKKGQRHSPGFMRRER